MATILKFKRRAVGGASGAPAALKSGEPAYNEVDGKLYLGIGDDGSGNATSIVPVGGPGGFADLNSAQTIAGVKTFGSSPLVPTAAVSDNSQKAASTGWVQAENFAKLATRLDQFAAPNVDVSLANHKLTNLSLPSAGGDAASKSYVDSVAQGLAWKAPVRVATTANITLSGAQTIDGVSLVAGNEVLVKNQTTPSQNGPYVVAAGTWSRRGDFDISAEALDGSALLVGEGAINGGVTFVLTTNNPITLDTTALTFTQITGGASGETNTGSNVGAAGQGVFDAKVGVDLQFRKLVTPAGSPIVLTLNAQTLEFTIPTLDGGTF